MMIRKDGDDHMRLRRLVSKVFTPRAISAWQAAGRGHRRAAARRGRRTRRTRRDRRLRAAAARAGHLRDARDADGRRRRNAAGVVPHAGDQGLDPFSTPAEEAAAEAAGRTMTDYLEQVVADKRALPGDDILTVADPRRGRRRRSRRQRDRSPRSCLLYIAGHETTRQPDRQRRHPPVPLPRPARAAAHRAGARRQRGRGGAALREPGPAHPARQPRAGRDRRHRDPGRQPHHAVAGRRPTTIHASGATRPTSSTSPGPAPTSTCPSAAARTSALARRWPRLEGRTALPRLVRRFPQIAPGLRRAAVGAPPHPPRRRDPPGHAPLVGLLAARSSALAR